jgi:hypothetical protein
MIKQLLFCALVASLAACQQDGDVQPNLPSLALDVAGMYRTNVFLDPSRVAVSADKMPFAELKTESDSTVSLVYTKLSPEKDIKEFHNVRLSRQGDVVLLKVADVNIGTLQTDRIFTNSGMEKQGRLLRLSIFEEPNFVLYFSGAKQ